AILAGSASTVVTVLGGPFDQSTEIIFDGAPVQTTMTSTSSLQATLPAASLAVAREASLSARRTASGTSVFSPPVSLLIGNPAPILSSLGNVPQPLLAGGAGFTMTVTGTGYAPGVSILIQGIPHPTTLESATTARVTIAPEDLSSGGILRVTAQNASPTIGPSNALNL